MVRPFDDGDAGARTALFLQRRLTVK